MTYGQDYGSRVSTRSRATGSSTGRKTSRGSMIPASTSTVPAARQNHPGAGPDPPQDYPPRNQWQPQQPPQDYGQFQPRQRHHRKRSRAPLYAGIAALIAIAAGGTVYALARHTASVHAQKPTVGWVRSDLKPVTQPELAGGVLVFYVEAGGGLQVAALDPMTGEDRSA